MFEDRLVKIKSINKMSKHIGKDVAKNMDIPLKEFKNYITPREIRSIIRQHAVIKDEDIYMSSERLQNVFLVINSWVLGIQMSKLASEGKVEVYWDEEQNCATFSTKD
jgi:hypothetical protein